MLPQDQEFLEYLKETHAIALTPEDLGAIAEFHFQLKTQTQTRLAENAIEVPGTDANGGFGALIGGVLGLGLGIAIPGIGWALGLSIGASIGGKIGGLLEGKPKQNNDANKQPVARNAYGFDSTTGLIAIGGAIPLIYTNKVTNRFGGVRTSGFLVYSRVDTKNGGQKLYSLYALGLGQIGEISDRDLKLDNQKISTFTDTDVQFQYTVGSTPQARIPGFLDYSQAVNLNTNAQVGLDLRSEVKTSVTRTRDILAKADLMRNGFDGTARTKRIDFTKNGGNYALFVSKDALSIKKNVGQTGFIQGNVLRTNAHQFIGICLSRDPGSNFNAMPFCFDLKADGTFRILESGSSKYNSSYSKNDSFAIEYTKTSVIYRRNGGTIYTSAKKPRYNARLCVMIFDDGGDADGVRVNALYFAKNISYRKGLLQAGAGTQVTVSDETIDSFNPSESYLSRGRYFTVVSKNNDTNTLTLSQQLNLLEGDDIYKVDRVKFETSRDVDEITINLACNLWARNPLGEVIKHGIVFDVFIQNDRTPLRFIARLYISNKNEAEIRRSFSIYNLPKDTYTIAIDPVVSVDGNRTIYRLIDTGNTVRWDSGTSFGSQEVRLAAQAEIREINDDLREIVGFDGIFDDPDDDEDFDEDELKTRKRSLSSQQNPPIRITTINEILQGQSSYPGIAMAGLTFTASSRIQSMLTPSFLIKKGVRDRIHIAAGACTSSTQPQYLTDLAANFLAQGIRLGWTLRNLDKGTESIINGVSQFQIETVLNLNWQKRDRYLIYYNDSSCYFPDIFASTLANPEGGLGAIVDADEFIDYPSIVRSRQFCVANNFYWDGVISNSIAWSQWASEESVGSLLFPSRIDGRFALIPEQETNPAMLFNASNTFDYSEEYVDWAGQKVNVIIVTYTDGNSNYESKTVEIATIAAYTGAEQRYEESLQLPAITNRDQAIRAGAIALKSRKIQDRAIDFSTGLQGCYLMPGDLIIMQHVATEWNFEGSGFAITATSTSPQVLTVSVPLEGFARSTRCAILHKDSGNVSTDLPAAVDPVAQTVTVQNQEAINIEDAIVFGSEIASKRTYRISGINPTEEGFAQVSAIYWHPDILTLSGLYVDDIFYEPDPILPTTDVPIYTPQPDPPMVDIVDPDLAIQLDFGIISNSVYSAAFC